MAKKKTKVKNEAAVALGRLGGAKGGKAKVKKGIGSLTVEERKAIARKGVEARKKNAAKRAKEQRAETKES